MNSPRAMRTLAQVGIIAALALVSACGGRQRGPETVREIDRLRASFEAEPENVEIAGRLAEAELFTADGDPRRATAPLEKLSELEPTRPDVHHMMGLERLLHGHMTEAAESFLTALDLARGSHSPRDVAIVESSIEKLTALSGYVGEAPLIREQLRLHYEDSGELGYGAFSRLASAQIEQAYREGSREAAIAVAQAAGCPTEYRVAGPFGPRELLDFERAFPPEEGEWEEAYDLGPMRGVREVRKIGTRGCEAHLGNGPYADGGVTYAKSVVEAPRDGLYLLRVETPNSMMVWIDGEKVGEVDRRKVIPALEWEREIELTAGSHEVLVKVASRHPNPVLLIGLREKAPGDVALVEASSPYTRYLRAERLVSRGDVLGARELYRPVEDELGGMAVSHYVTVVQRDPLKPDDIRRDKSRALLRRLNAQDPDAWYAILELASLASAEGRSQEAIKALREHDERFPEVYGVVASLRDLLSEAGFHAEADRLLDRLDMAGPTACGAIEARLQSSLRRDRHVEAARLAEELVGCNAQSHAMYNLHLRRQDYEAAEAELERIASLESEDKQPRFIGTRVYLARARGELDRAAELLEEMRAADPRSSGPVYELFDRELARGQRKEAFARLEGAIRAEPDAMLSLRFLRSDLGEEDPFAGHRVDGLAEIAAYGESDVSYTQGSVLVLDHMVTRIFEDGSAAHLVHQIRHINSDEAVNEHGEFGAPDGADLLLLRTVKADGTLLEPDRIGGKATISLPNLARGDFVEAVYQYGTTPAPGMEGAVEGGRFIFENFEVPFHRSEIVFVYPPSVEPVFEVRGDLPEPSSETRGGLTVRRYRVDRRMPPEREAMSVHPLEYFPSVQWGIGQTWDRLVEAVADMLVDLDLTDPAHVSLARQIAGEGDVRERARRIHRWVMQNVQNGDGITSQAAPMLETRSGSQIRIVRYLLGLADIPSTLLLVRPFNADQTKSEIATFDTYEHPVLRIGEGSEAIYLASGGRNVPFGYLPAFLRGADALEVERGGSIAELPTRGVGEDHRKSTLR